METVTILEQIKAQDPDRIYVLIEPSEFPSFDAVHRILRGTFLRKGVTTEELKGALLEVESVERAKRIATTLLCRSLAYKVDVLPVSKASKLIEQYFACFTDIQKLYTNTVWTDGGEYLVNEQWFSFTSSTFDSGLLILDSKGFGVLWIEEED